MSFIARLGVKMEANLNITLKQPTMDQVPGPFYPVIKPSDQDADLTVVKGKAGKAKGQVIYILGQVVNIDGKPIPKAKVEIWQANSFGRYTHPSDNNPAPLDPNFEGYGVQVTDNEGRYRFKTIKPGPYPVPDGWTRPPHIHFCITSRTNMLITQLYFEGEPLNDKDLFFRTVLHRDTVLAKLISPTKEFESDSLIAQWDIVLAQK